MINWTSFTFIILAILAIFQGFSAQVNLNEVIQNKTVFFNGTCPDISRTFLPLNESTLLGQWYLLNANPNIVEQGKKCNFVEITKENGTHYFTRLETDIGNEQLVTFRGTVDLHWAEGFLNFHYMEPIDTIWKMQFIGGDMVNYCLVYQCIPCSEYGDSGMHIYLYARARNPNCTVIEGVNRVLAGVNLTLPEVPTYIQDGCLYG